MFLISCFLNFFFYSFLTKAINKERAQVGNNNQTDYECTTWKIFWELCISLFFLLLLLFRMLFFIVFLILCSIFYWNNFLPVNNKTTKYKRKNGCIFCYFISNGNQIVEYWTILTIAQNGTFSFIFRSFYLHLISDS